MAPERRWLAEEEEPGCCNGMTGGQGGRHRVLLWCHSSGRCTSAGNLKKYYILKKAYILQNWAKNKI